jgi:hypothetical protein
MRPAEFANVARLVMSEPLLKVCVGAIAERQCASDDVGIRVASEPGWGNYAMWLPRRRFTIRQMMVAVAVIGIELALICTVANAIGGEVPASAWLVSTAVVVGLHILGLPLVHVYITRSRIVEVITYKGPVTYNGQVLRKEDKQASSL